MRKTILLSLSLLCACALSATTKSYTADDNTDFWNPERGFYHYSDVVLNGKGGGGLGNGNIQGCKNDNMSLLFRYFYLNHYNTGAAITQSDLNMIANDFAVARANGIKIIVRFSYGEQGYHGDDNWSFTEPSKSGMQAHMAQLKPILANNADVIACVQAGFVGIWGEWYFSSTFGKDWSKPNAKNDRNDLINSLLDMTPADRCLQLRSIHYITEYIGNGSANYNTKLTDQTAFSGSAQSRIGHHNDAFCADRENQGTYRDYNNERTYLANLSQYVPVGGENNEYDNTYTTGAKAMADMEQFHYDYLNTEFYDVTINNWKSQKKDGVSYYDIMKRRLGYRLQLQSFTYDDQVAKNAKLNVTLKIKNAGFSNLYNKRIAYLVLKNNSKTYQIALASDPRLWKSGQVTTITEKLTLPSNIATGTYNVYLYLPDYYASIASNAAYAVRLANQNMGWSNGMNDLGASITVTAAQEGGQDQEEEEEEEQGQGQGQETPPSTTECEVAVALNTGAQMTDAEGGTASCSVSGDVLTVDYQINGAWNYTGVEFPIGSRSDIESVTFSFKGSASSSSWTALHVYLTDGSTRYVDSNADYSIHTDDGWQTVTIAPNMELWGSAASIDGISMTKVGFMANPEVAVSSSFQIKDIYLNIKDCVPSTPTDVPAIQERVQADKFIHNGHLYIRHQGRIYNVLAQPL